MRIAALYDIHGNLPALEAVLDEVRRAGVDAIVVGGDVVPGPMPRETLGLPGGARPAGALHHAATATAWSAPNGAARTSAPRCRRPSAT